jgi:hypothetical protein
LGNLGKFPFVQLPNTDSCPQSFPDISIMPRYVVLFHQMPVGSSRVDHWDFMLEYGSSLATWALAREPDARGAILCEMLENHRVGYLDYEGPVARNRGTVTRWDAGTFVWNYRTQEEAGVTLEGSQLNGFVMLKKRDGEWQFEYVPSN